MPKSWALTFMINEEDAPTGRPAGALGWAGLPNLYYWIDRKNGIGGFWATQIFPFADPTSVGGYLDFEKAVYDNMPLAQGGLGGSGGSLRAARGELLRPAPRGAACRAGNTLPGRPALANAAVLGHKEAHASDAGDPRRGPHAGAPRPAHAQPYPPRHARRPAPAADGGAGGHLHRAVDAGHGPAALRPRLRRQRLVFSRSRRGDAVAAVEPSGERREDLGCRQAARSGLHLRQDVLVVQHVRQRRLERHAAADVSGRRPQDPRPLHLSGRAARRARQEARRLPAVQVLGPGRRHRIQRLDRARDRACARDPQADAHALLPAASRLQPAAPRPRSGASRASPRTWRRSTRCAAS